jgi:hypothetical protein
MKTGRTLQELATEIERRKSAKADYISPTEALNLELTQEANAEFERLISGEATSDFKELLRLNVGANKFRLNEISHDQLGTYLGIPAQYYDRMRANEPSLLVDNVNRWLKAQSGQNRLVRTLDGTVRAFLSDKFRPIENEQLCEALLPILLSDQFEIVSCQVTEKKLYIKVVDRSVSREMAKSGYSWGDGQHHVVSIVAPAIVVSNSEVGYGALSIQAGLWQSWCTNLSFFKASSMRRYHVGVRHEILGDDVVGMLSQQTQALTNAALLSRVQDVVRGAFDPERFNALVDKVEGTIPQKIEKHIDVVKLVNLTGKEIGTTEGENKGILNALISGGDLTRFGLFNAVTRYSADVDNYDRASELERAGAAVVELEQSDWDRLINKAAA